MRKRILILSLTYYPETVGGAEIAIKEITDRIDPKQFEFHMITLRFNSHLPKQEKIGRVFVHRIGYTKPNPTASDLKKFPLHFNKHFFQFIAAIKAMNLNRKYKYDIIWAMMAHSCSVPVAIFNIFNPHIPYVLTLQEGDPLDRIEKNVKPLWALFVRGFKKASIIQPISNFLANWAKKLNPNAHIEIIPNGTSLKNFYDNIPEQEINNLKQRLGKKESEIYLITTSRLVHKNGINDVLNALTKLPDNIQFLILGNGPDEEKLKTLAKNLKIENKTKFIGFVDNKETKKYLKVSDIFIRPSRSEGMGNSFIEAMAARLPVISTQVGGISDFLFDAKKNPDKKTTGWAVDKDSPEQIAQAVKDILANPVKAKEVVDNAYNFTKLKYNWDIIAQDMKEKVFKKLIK